MARLKDYIEYVGAQSGAFFARMMSPPMADRFGAGLGLLMYKILSLRRKVAYDNLSQAMGDSLSEIEIERIIKNVFQNLGRTLIEMSRLGKVTTDDLCRIIIADEIIEYAQQAHEGGRGALILSAHFGNWEYLCTWFAAMGYKTDLLVGVQHNPLIHNMISKLRMSTGARIIPASTGVRDVLKALRDNHFIAVVADQHNVSGMPIDFFNRKAAFARGPATFALKTGCPLLPVLMRRERYDRHVIMSDPPIYPQRDVDKEEEIKRITISIARFYEKGIRKYPDQWMWTHRRWKL